MKAMKVLIVYDSKWGNTELVAKAVAAGLGKSARAVRVGEAPAGDFDKLELLVLGSPVHGGRPTKPIQEYMKGIPGGSAGKLRIGAFDTRMTTNAAQKFGFAAVRMLEQLKAQGCAVVSEPMGFIVTGQKGPLAEGELERASQWGKDLAGG
jgi:flavodoxin